jgi:glucose-6-phosphate dehydrogenase assembly protein OpcA
MATQSPPIVSLQSPKDVSISEIEAELRDIWHSYNADGDNGEFPGATRATTFTFVVYEPEETQQLLAGLGFYKGPIDGIDGPLTESSVKAAQKAYGLAVTGKSDAKTLSRLREEFAAARSSAIATNGEDGNKQLADPNNRGFVVADAIAAANPCRIIALCPMSGEDEGVTAQVSAYCPINKQSQNTLICCEYITLRGTAEALERIGGIVEALTISDLPKFLWWKATPDPNNGLFKRLSAVCTSIIVDSCSFNAPETDLLRVQTLLEQGIQVADLNWRRLAAWQELTAEAFDPPERREAINEVDRVTIDYEKGNPAQAMMFLGWLASRLQWRPISYKEEGGDYDIKRIQFVATDQRPIEAELAGVPTADWGDIAGDMVGIRLTSTNVDADCCTVLCSETTGCMRMEAGGGAQSCRIQQVTPLTDQKAEFLLSQQLRRWGREMLYEESLAVAAQILRLNEAPEQN